MSLSMGTNTVETETRAKREHALGPRCKCLSTWMRLVDKFCGLSLYRWDSVICGAYELDVKLTLRLRCVIFLTI